MKAEIHGGTTDLNLEQGIYLKVHTTNDCTTHQRYQHFTIRTLVSPLDHHRTSIEDSKTWFLSDIHQNCELPPVVHSSAPWLHWEDNSPSDDVIGFER
jgi:hypothetical protein